MKKMASFCLVALGLSSCFGGHDPKPEDTSVLKLEIKGNDLTGKTEVSTSQMVKTDLGEYQYHFVFKLNKTVDGAYTLKVKKTADENMLGDLAMICEVGAACKNVENNEYTEEFELNADKSSIEYSIHYNLGDELPTEAGTYSYDVVILDKSGAERMKFTVKMMFDPQNPNIKVLGEKPEKATIPTVKLYEEKVVKEGAKEVRNFIYKGEASEGANISVSVEPKKNGDLTIATWLEFEASNEDLYGDYTLEVQTSKDSKEGYVSMLCDEGGKCITDVDGVFIQPITLNVEKGAKQKFSVHYLISETEDFPTESYDYAYDVRLKKGAEVILSFKVTTPYKAK